MCKLCDKRPYGTCGCGCGKPRGKRGCTAHAATKKQLCEKPPCKGRHVCAKHGGKTPRGPASPHWKTGVYSVLFRDLPERYWQSAIATITSPETRSNRAQIAMMDARADELMGQLSTGEHGHAWRRAGVVLALLQRAFHAGNVEQCQRQAIDPHVVVLPVRPGVVELPHRSVPNGGPIRFAPQRSFPLTRLVEQHVPSDLGVVRGSEQAFGYVHLHRIVEFRISPLSQASPAAVER